MMTVRFASGVAITHNQATWLRYRGDGGWELYTADPDKGGLWVASIQKDAGAVVEVQRACRVENPADALTGEGALKEVAERIREFSASAPRLAARLKRELRAFNATKCSWSDR